MITLTTFYELFMSIRIYIRIWADERYALKTQGLATTNAFDIDLSSDLMPALSVVVEDPDFELDINNDLMPKEV